MDGNKDKFTDQSITEENKPGISYLHIPENLDGKHVLEIFSGNDGASLKQILELRGANYTSLDKYQSTGDFSFAQDATKTLPFIPNSFNYILMISPPVWLGESEIDTKMVIGILKNCLPVLKKESGNFIGSLMHLDDANKDKLMQAIRDDPVFENFMPIFEKTDIQATDLKGNELPGKEWSFRLIVN